MKKVSLIFICLLCCFGIQLVPSFAQEAFVIDDLKIHMVVAEDGTYTIEETYVMNFQQERHGFYRSIPTKYEMKWTDNESGEVEDRKYYFPITNINCGDAQYDTSYEDGSVIIKIGDPDKTIIGKQTYRISYQVQTKDLDYNNTQMLYWNLVGNSFDTTIKSMSYTIKMPKAFDETQISTYTGAYLSAYQNLSYEVDGNVISGQLLKPLHNYESATIKLNLSDDYFTFPVPTNYLLYAMIASGILTGIALLLFWRFGKDDDVIITVEFKAPQGLDSAGVGYVIDGISESKDVLSLLMDWANRGYMIIHEDSDNQMTLEKVKDLDADAKPYERTFFQAIFKQGDLVNEAMLKEAQVGTALAKAKGELGKYFQTKKRSIFTGSSIGLQFFMCFMVALPTVLCSFAVCYMHYGMLEMTLPSGLLALFGAVASLPWIFLMRKRYVLKKTTYFLLVGLCFALNAIVFTITVILMLLWGPSNAWMYAILYVAIEIAMLLMLIFMDKRTKIGNQWLGQILGLKDFILNCEKERLELLVEDQPSAFFDVLPYAYVLGVSDVWAKKFEHIIIATPSWYQSDTYYGNTFTTWLWWSHFHHSFHNVSQAASFVEMKNSTSGHGGGSFGGFSGGGFSGGGFGGGGGGSW